MPKMMRGGGPRGMMGPWMMMMGGKGMMKMGMMR